MTPGAPAVTATDRVEIVPTERWDATLAADGLGDVYLRRGYHAASLHLEPDPAGALLLRVPDADGAFSLPLLARALPGGGGLDLTSAYGYGGPAVAGAPDLAAVGRALDEWARANRVATTFLRLHPLLGNQAHVPPQAQLVPLGATVAWRLDAHDDLRAAMHSHHRRAANKADRAGVDVRITVAPPDLDAFRALYDVTMTRQQAAAYYFFPAAYWQALLDDPGGDLVLVDGVVDGEVVASLLCLADDRSLHYHLGATADAARNIGASNRLFLAAAEWARDRGLTRFHLGGGVGADTTAPLFVFKHRYDPASEPLPFHIAKWVHDPQLYRRLTGGDDTGGFFPPWRAPAP